MISRRYFLVYFFGFPSCFVNGHSPYIASLLCFIPYSLISATFLFTCRMTTRSSWASGWMREGQRGARHVSWAWGFCFFSLHPTSFRAAFWVCFTLRIMLLFVFYITYVTKPVRWYLAQVNVFMILSLEGLFFCYFFLFVQFNVLQRGTCIIKDCSILYIVSWVWLSFLLRPMTKTSIGLIIQKSQILCFEKFLWKKNL